jgi:hypothetical protein
MDKAIRQNIDRRALLKGASLSAIAAAIPAIIATPALAEAPDPIFNLFAKRDQLRILARAADARMVEIKSPLGPVIDFGHPEFAPMAQGNSYDQAKDGKEITREEIEEYNARDESWALDSDFNFMWDAVVSAGRLRRLDRVAAGDALTVAGERMKALQVPSRAAKAKAKKARREGKARLAWWDAEHARLKPALDAYELHRPPAKEAAKESEEIWERVDDVTAEISTSPAVTLAGAMAQLGEAVRQINVNHSDYKGNVDTGEIEIGERAVINAYETLVRLCRDRRCSHDRNQDRRRLRALAQPLDCQVPRRYPRRRQR